MPRQIFFGLVFVLFLLIPGPARAGDYYTLYGFKIGQPIALVKNTLGKPYRVHRFADGWVVYIYRLTGHNVAFEASKENPDLIISIQIEGYRNPRYLGLDGVDLGSDAKAAIRQFGRPTERKPSIDLITKKPMPGTFINYYGKSFSFEEKNGKVSSIKVIFAGARKAPGSPDIRGFFQNLKHKNYYKLSEQISGGIKVRGKPVARGPLLWEIKSGSLSGIFFDRRTGRPRLSYRDIREGNMRVADRRTGYVLKFKNKHISELVFYPSFEGWVLAEIW